MNPIDILKLGHLQFSSHKIRNFLAIITAGILFSALFAVQFVLSGLRDTLLSANREITGDEIVLVNQDCHDVFDDNGAQNSICREDRIRELVAEHHGEIIGYAKKAGTAFVIPANIIANFPWGDTLDQPNDTIPIMIPAGIISIISQYKVDGSILFVGTYIDTAIYEKNDASALPFYDNPSDLIEEYTHKIISLPDAELYIARVSPNHANNIIQLPESNFPNLLNLPLELMSNVSGDTIILDDGSAAVRDFLSSAPPDNTVTFMPSTSLIVRFTNPEDAYKYNLALEHLNTIATHTMSFDLFGNQTSVIRGYDTLNNLLLIPLLGLIFVAIFIMSLTFVSLIRQNAAIVALYRSVGATRRDLVLVHLVYLFELCFFTLIFALALGLFFAFLISNANSDALSAAIADNYMIERPGFIFLVGPNWQTFLMLGLILLIPFVATLLTFDQLSAKNLARRLKSDE